MFTPAPTVAYRERVDGCAWLAANKAGVRLPIMGPLRVDLLIVRKRPKALNRRKDPPGLLWCPVAPDVDNVCKCVLDGLNRGAIGDDGQVVELHALDAYAEKGGAARVEVRLSLAVGVGPSALSW